LLLVKILSLKSFSRTTSGEEYEPYTAVAIKQVLLLKLNDLLTGFSV
jgi:hypothetical protein